MKSGKFKVRLDPILEFDWTRTSSARRKMAGKRNRLERVYKPGKALSAEPLREEIIEMYNEGFSLTDISNDVKVTVRGVNKIINHYPHHGTLIPFCHGGSEADVVTDDVLHCIEIWKLQRPSIYARENTEQTSA